VTSPNGIAFPDVRTARRFISEKSIVDLAYLIGRNSERGKPQKAHQLMKLKLRVILALQ
jgi:hypothetical protein